MKNSESKGKVLYTKYKTNANRELEVRLQSFRKLIKKKQKFLFPMKVVVIGLCQSI